MQKIRRFFILSVAAVLLFAVTSAGHFLRLSATAADYYAGITATEGDALLGQLHDLITTTHTRYTSYKDCKNPTYVKKTDPGTGGALMEFYAHENLSSSWQGAASGTWNREHVWCQSLSGPSKSNTLWGESGGGSDLHHIRPTESRVNSARGNNKFAEFSGGSTVTYRDASNTVIGPAGATSGGKFEPLDFAKGDVARIVMYVYTHYNTYSNVHGTTNGRGNSNYFGTLKFTYVVSAGSEDAAIALLLKWNELDPVDSIERTRNDAVYEIQGNRNPFIDHPEYAEAIWGDGDIGGGGDGGGGDIGGGDAENADFHAAVAALVTDGTLAERFQSIAAAVAVYRKLTPAEKNVAQTDIATLQAAIDAYNEAAAAYNGVAEQMNGAALSASGVLCGGGI